MNMIRQKIDEYLDGALGAAEREEIERLLAHDKSAARILRSARSERAIRMAAYASHAPDDAQAAALANRVMAAIAAQGDRPAGRIGYWVRRISAVAAALAVVAGSFAFGRMSVPTKKLVQDQPAPQVIYRVMYTGQDGAAEMREFVSQDDANAFAKQLDLKQRDQLMISTNNSDEFDADRPGSL